MLIEGRDTEFADLVCLSRENRARRTVCAKMVPCRCDPGKGERWQEKRLVQRRDLA